MKADSKPLEVNKWKESSLGIWHIIRDYLNLIILRIRILYLNSYYLGSILGNSLIKLLLAIKIIVNFNLISPKNSKK